MIVSQLELAAAVVAAAAKELHDDNMRTANLMIDRSVLYNMEKAGLIGCKCLRNAIHWGEFRQPITYTRFA